MKVELGMDEGLDVRAFSRAVKSAGFKPRWVWVRSTDRKEMPSVHRLDTTVPNPTWEVELRPIEEAIRSPPRS